MTDFGPERVVPPEEYALARADEEFLLMDPVTNAGALHDIYEARAAIHAQRLQSGVDSALDDWWDTVQRMKLVSKLLPDDDPRSYEAVKRQIRGAASPDSDSI